MTTELIVIESLIEDTRELWNQGKKVMIQVAYNLTQIRDSGVWKVEHDSFQKFCEMELDIHQSQTSKLLKIADYYLEKFSPQEIGAVDYERLYSATLLPGSVESNLFKAKTLTRHELKLERSDEEAVPHTPDFKRICVHAGCWLTEEAHP